MTKRTLAQHIDPFYRENGQDKAERIDKLVGDFLSVIRDYETEVPLNTHVTQFNLEVLYALLKTAGNTITASSNPDIRIEAVKDFQKLLKIRLHYITARHSQKLTEHQNTSTTIQ